MTDEDLMALMLRVDPMTKRIPPGVRAIVEAVEAAERERCAKLCEDRAAYAADVVFDEAERRAAQDCADAIRRA